MRTNLLLFCLTIGCGLLLSQGPTPRPFRVVRLDPALDDIISTDAKLETLGEHFGLIEGPVWCIRGQKQIRPRMHTDTH
jgi:hypothetical protein